eukprot:TRINITY_DN29116_c0_g1_i1.p1 TRINITY_DN29116_c0_g1~~TRINITY_DN29116_c0_g1_i1.p1  ORF type:complete len:218 (-),score=39.66 TRINITY_DN29116_c0_g1_i1:73-726(-)
MSSRVASEVTDAMAGQRKRKEAGNEEKIRVNRAPVLTLWVAVVAEREGYSFEEGLSFGKAISGLFALSKGRRLGLYEEEDREREETDAKAKGKKAIPKFEVFGLKINGCISKEGLRLALQNGKPISPASSEAYLRRAFGENFERVKEAMQELARSYAPERIGSEAYSLYEKFRPNVPAGIGGWGALGVLDLGIIRSLSREAEGDVSPNETESKKRKK